MTKERWIVVPNWDEFQHYKERDPKWIKVYRRLHSDDDYLRLSGHRRAVLLGIWLEYASSHAQLRLDSVSLSRRLNLRVTSSDLKALNHAGFIEVSASRPLAKPTQNGTKLQPRLDKRREDKRAVDLDVPESNGRSQPSDEVAEVIKAQFGRRT